MSPPFTFICQLKGLAVDVTDFAQVEQMVEAAVAQFGTMAAEMTFTYNVSKAAVDMMTKCAALELAPYRIRAATQSLSGGIENLIEEAVKLRTFTDDQGRPLDGSKRYKLTFSADQIPKVDAFWSITLYDNRFNLVQNEADKYAVRDIDPDLVYGDDGSLTIYLQSKRPTEAGVNWIPTPADSEFNLFFRAYLPERAFIDQSYEPPAVQLIN